MDVSKVEVPVNTDTDVLHQEILALKASVESLDRSIRGDTVNDPGIVGRLRAVEEWKKSREAFEGKVAGALITMALTGAGTLILAFIKLTGIKP